MWQDFQRRAGTASPRRPMQRTETRPDGMPKMRITFRRCPPGRGTRPTDPYERHMRRMLSHPRRDFKPSRPPKGQLHRLPILKRSNCFARHGGGEEDLFLFLFLFVFCFCFLRWNLVDKRWGGGKFWLGRRRKRWISVFVGGPIPRLVIGPRGTVSCEYKILEANTDLSFAGGHRGPGNETSNPPKITQRLSPGGQLCGQLIVNF